MSKAYASLPPHSAAKRAYVAVLTTELDDNADGRSFIANIGKQVADYLHG
ncbi:hypothetical protein [Brevibacillus massiliensis]|nr:hypothetical protein [Brevibacillus massiliensis]